MIGAGPMLSLSVAERGEISGDGLLLRKPIIYTICLAAYDPPELMFGNLGWRASRLGLR